MDITAYGFVYTLTGSLFFRHGIDAGGRLYLTTENWYNRKIPYMSEEKKYGKIIFKIPERDVPEEYHGFFPAGGGLIEFELPKDKDFIREYIKFVPISIIIKT